MQLYGNMNGVVIVYCIHILGLPNMLTEGKTYCLSHETFFFFFRNNYNILLTPQFEHLTPYIPKHFMYGEVPIQFFGASVMRLIIRFYITYFNIHCHYFLLGLKEC